MKNNGIIKKEDCGGKIPVAFTSIRRPTDQDYFIQYLLFYYRNAHYKYILPPNRKIIRQGEKRICVGCYKHEWQQFYACVGGNTLEMVKERRKELIERAKKEINKFSWKEALEHPKYPMVYV